MTDTAPARPERHRSLPVALRAAVALVAMLTVMTVGLAGLFASAASAQPLRRPETRVTASTAAAGQMVGAHQPVLAGQRRARAPSYDQIAVGSCVAAESEPSLAGCGLSFAAATPVLLADGSTKPISQIATEDKVVATDTATGKNQTEPVLAVMVNQDTDLYNLTIQSGGTTSVIHTTGNHPFWDQTTHAWTQAGKLHPGDHLQTPGLNLATVVSGITPAVTSGAMWDLTVSTDHDFYITTSAAAVLVHNCGTDAFNGEPGSSPALNNNPWSPDEVEARIQAAQDTYDGPTSVNQMDQQIRAGQAPEGVYRADNAHVPTDQPHIHLGPNEGSPAVNIDGSWRHGPGDVSNAIAQWLTDNGWEVP